MAADESMAHKADEINKLRRERDHTLAEFDKLNQLLPVLKAQVNCQYCLDGYFILRVQVRSTAYICACTRLRLCGSSAIILLSLTL